jgi:hypothetical protein
VTGDSVPLSPIAELYITKPVLLNQDSIQQFPTSFKERTWLRKQSSRNQTPNLSTSSFAVERSTPT